MSSLPYRDTRVIFKIGKIFLCISGITVTIYSLFTFSNDAACNLLREISFEERYFLDYFFRNLLLKERGAFVLNGSKPAVLENFRFPTTREVIFLGIVLSKQKACSKKVMKHGKNMSLCSLLRTMRFSVEKTKRKNYLKSSYTKIS